MIFGWNNLDTKNLLFAKNPVFRSRKKLGNGQLFHCYDNHYETHFKLFINIFWNKSTKIESTGPSSLLSVKIKHWELLKWSLFKFYVWSRGLSVVAKALSITLYQWVWMMHLLNCSMVVRILGNKKYYFSWFTQCLDRAKIVPSIWLLWTRAIEMSKFHWCHIHKMKMRRNMLLAAEVALLKLTLQSIAQQIRFFHFTAWLNKTDLSCFDVLLSLKWL